MVAWSNELDSARTRRTVRSLVKLPRLFNALSSKTGKQENEYLYVRNIVKASKRASEISGYIRPVNKLGYF
jgi:hypothetical protein